MPVELLRVLPPSAFWPRPKVSSAFIQITLEPPRRERIADRAFFHDFVRSMFCHRRKFLRSELLAACKGKLEKPDVDRLLIRQGLDGTDRAERAGPGRDAGPLRGGAKRVVRAVNPKHWQSQWHAAVSPKHWQSQWQPTVSPHWQSQRHAAGHPALVVHFLVSAAGI